jgi:excisionase family DNA binding protein
MASRREILRPVEVGRLLGLGRTRVYALLRNGILPSVRVAGSIWIPRAALDEWLCEQSKRALAATRASESAGADR